MIFYKLLNTDFSVKISVLLCILNYKLMSDVVIRINYPIQDRFQDGHVNYPSVAVHEWSSRMFPY
jgi:hypothetical protein